MCTGMVNTQVDGGGTAAAGPLSIVFFPVEIAFQKAGNEERVDASCVADVISGQIDILRTGVQAQTIGTGNV